MYFYQSIKYGEKTQNIIAKIIIIAMVRSCMSPLGFLTQSRPHLGQDKAESDIRAPQSGQMKRAIGDLLLADGNPSGPWPGSGGRVRMLRFLGGRARQMLRGPRLSGGGPGLRGRLSGGGAPLAPGGGVGGPCGHVQDGLDGPLAAGVECGQGGEGAPEPGGDVQGRGGG